MPSRSLWSRRKRSRLASGIFGDQNDHGSGSALARPLCDAVYVGGASGNSINESARLVPAGTVNERPETGEPFTIMETTEYARDAAPARTS